jgi:hypothetical protein
MLTIGVITRGKYGKRLLDTIKNYTEFTPTCTAIPTILPDLIDDPASFTDRLAMNQDVFCSDIVITYSLHPDISPEIVRRAAQAGAKAVIIPGGRLRAGDPHLLQAISQQYGTRILIEDLCCETGSDTDPTVNEFASVLGRPKLRIEAENGSISNVTIIRGAPCGSTWWMGQHLTGVPLSDAPARAGLLVQQYPCRAIRGTKNGIHLSAHLHKKAVEDAIKKYYKEKG